LSVVCVWHVYKTDLNGSASKARLAPKWKRSIFPEKPSSSSSVKVRPIGSIGGEQQKEGRVARLGFVLLAADKTPNAFRMEDEEEGEEGGNA